MRSPWFRRFALIALIGLLIVGYGFSEARRDPAVHRTTIAMPDWPAGAPPVTVALLSDIHIGNQTMDATRLSRIVGQVNALKPDYVMIAGDLIAGGHKGSAATLGPAMIGPLSALSPRIGKIAVLGNHDHYTGAEIVRSQLTRAGFTVLDNQAASFGPLAIGGVGDQFSKHADVKATVAALAPLPGAHLFLTHSPGIARHLPTNSLLLAGHTHCGQVVPAFIGELLLSGHPDLHYFCGEMHQPGHTVVVTAGLGTSILPLRLGAPPDFWLIRLGPATFSQSRP